MRMLLPKTLGAAFILVSGLTLTLAVHVTHAKTPPSLAKFGMLKTFCGTDDIPRDVTTIPWIGCFMLSAGHSATGILSNHHIEVAVSAEGEEVFTADGTVIKTNRPPQTPPHGTNVPYVYPMGSGYAFCEGTGTPYCLTDIGVHSRNADHSTIFTVSECYAPEYRVCVLTQENWDFYKAHPNSRPH